MNSVRSFATNLFKIRDSREALARGASIGFFWGVSILWGGQIAGAIVTSHLLKGNKVIAASMTAVSNPLTTIPLYSLCYIIGHFIIPGPDLGLTIANLHSFQEILNQGTNFFITMGVGTTIVGIVGSAIIYFAVKKIFPERADRESTPAIGQ